MKCSQCNQDNTERAKVCVKCGANIRVPAKEANEQRVTEVIRRQHMNTSTYEPDGPMMRQSSDKTGPAIQPSLDQSNNNYQERVIDGTLVAKLPRVAKDTSKQVADIYRTLRVKPKIFADAVKSGKIKAVVDNEFVNTTLSWFRVSDVRLRIPVYVLWGILVGVFMSVTSKQSYISVGITMSVYAYLLGSVGGPLNWIVDKVRHLPFSWIFIGPFITVPWYCFGWPAEKLYEFIFWRFTCLNMGAAYLERGEYGKARKELEMAKVSSSDKEGKLMQYALLGEARAELEEYDEAILAYAKAIEFDPNDSGLKMDMAYCHLMKEDYENALRLLSDELKRDQKNPAIYMGISRCYLNMDKYEVAMSYLKQLTEMEPASATAHKMLAEAYIGLGDKVGALKEAQLSLTFGPASSVAEQAQEIIDSIQGGPVSVEQKEKEYVNDVTERQNKVIVDVSPSLSKATEMPVVGDGEKIAAFQENLHLNTMDNSMHSYNSVCHEEITTADHSISGDTTAQESTVSGRQTLIDEHADATPSDESLINAAIIGDLAEIKILLNKGGNINAKDEHGHTLLMYATENGDTDIAKYLISNGVNVNTQDDVTGFSPLILAGRDGRTEIARLLIESGADAQMTTFYGESAVYFATRNGKFDTAEILKSAGSDALISQSEGCINEISSSATGAELYNKYLSLALADDTASNSAEHRINILNRALQSDLSISDRVPAHAFLGAELFNLKRNDEAAGHYEYAVTLASKHNISLKSPQMILLYRRLCLYYISNARAILGNVRTRTKINRSLIYLGSVEISLGNSLCSPAFYLETANIQALNRTAEDIDEAVKYYKKAISCNIVEDGDEEFVRCAKENLMKLENECVSSSRLTAAVTETSHLSQSSQDRNIGVLHNVGKKRQASTKFAIIGAVIVILILGGLFIKSYLTKPAVQELQKVIKRSEPPSSQPPVVREVPTDQQPKNNITSVQSTVSEPGGAAQKDRMLNVAAKPKQQEPKRSFAPHSRDDL